MLKYLKLLETNSSKKIFKLLDGKNTKSWTYDDFLSDVRKCAYKLEDRLGNIEGKHVGIISNSDYEYIVLLNAIVFSRAVAVPINNLETEKNILSAIEIADIHALVIDDATHNDYAEIKVVYKNTIFEDSVQEKELSDFTDSEAERLALILFTSGTTSLSKAVSLSVGNLFGNARLILPEEYVELLYKTDSVTGFTNFPFYHVGAITCWLSCSELGGILCVSKSAKNILIDMEYNKIDFAVGTPALVNLWAKCLKRGKIERLGGVKHIVCGGASLEPDIIHVFNENGISIGLSYGQTEVGGAVTYNFDVKGHIKSVGKALDDVKIHIIDGEICIGYWGNMMGYYNNPDETAKYVKNGVVHTGDLGYLDDDGYLYITGRKKNLIILSGGENVSPEEIESKLYECSSIKECLTYEKNDRIYVDIYAPSMKQEDVKKYIDMLNLQMPFYKRIYGFNLLENELDKTALGKIKRQ